MIFSIALFILFLFLIIWIFKRAAGFLKSTTLLLFIIIVIILAFTLDNSKEGHIVKAVSYIKNWVQSSALPTGNFIKEHFDIPVIKIKDQVDIDAPVISQLPELPRGCEVTSLAMLLNQARISVDKMELAEKVKKDPTKKKYTNGEIHFGNPNDGFVGNMYTFQAPGLGVYHDPIAKLAEHYLPGKITDLTGSDFEELKTHLSDGRPIWVIINTSYQKLPENLFETWNTPTGQVKITYKEHSVLITGYDSQFIYFNDPLTGTKNKKAPIKDFEESWVQMGRQAITYLP
ncbi:MAG TPA: C39 family peptidase [Bacillales bacterium]|nr:C39 family peptidase [Bacillales bacterium]